MDNLDFDKKLKDCEYPEQVDELLEELDIANSIDAVLCNDIWIASTKSI